MAKLKDIISAKTFHGMFPDEHVANKEYWDKIDKSLQELWTMYLSLKHEQVNFNKKEENAMG